MGPAECTRRRSMTAGTCGGARHKCVGCVSQGARHTDCGDPSVSTHGQYNNPCCMAAAHARHAASTRCPQQSDIPSLGHRQALQAGAVGADAAAALCHVQQLILLLAIKLLEHMDGHVAQVQAVAARGRQMLAMQV